METATFNASLPIHIAPAISIPLAVTAEVDRADPNLTNLPTGIYFHVKHPLVPTTGWRTGLRLSDYPELRSLILEAIGLPPTTKLYYHQLRGCSCGCSPAYWGEGVGRVSVTM